jgi:hypothetical protein
MKIEIAEPPNIEQIAVVFPRRGSKVIYAYGDTIYNPSGGPISPALMAHEEMHGKRQRVNSVETWWEQYLKDPEFRYHEELIAHAVEMQSQATRDRNRNIGLITSTAYRLVAEFYEYGKSARSYNRAWRDLNNAVAVIYT